MVEYAFRYQQPIPAGRVVFRFRNAGREDHHVRVFPLPDDVPSLAAQIRGTERRILPVFAGLPPRKQGQVGTFALDLAAGQRYAIMCYAEAEEGKFHFSLGMNSEFRAGGGTAQTVPATSSSTVRSGPSPP